MKQIIAIAVLLSCASTASAALLIEITNESVFLANEVTAIFGTGRPPFPDGSTIPARIGVCCINPLTPGMDTATPEQLARMELYFADGSREFVLGMNGATGFYAVDSLWSAGTVNAIFGNTVARIMPHATPRGSGLSGYRLTEVTTQTMPILLSGRETGMQQKTLIYGEPVPEPSTWVLVATVFTAFAYRRTR